MQCAPEHSEFEATVLVLCWVARAAACCSSCSAAQFNTKKPNRSKRLAKAGSLILIEPEGLRYTTVRLANVRKVPTRRCQPAKYI